MFRVKEFMRDVSKNEHESVTAAMATQFTHMCSILPGWTYEGADVRLFVFAHFKSESASATWINVQDNNRV